jgi:hypothetical protein
MIRRSGVLVAAVTVVAAVLISSVPASAAQGSSNPPRGSMRAGHTKIVAPAKAIKAVVVESWGQCSSGSLVWDDLNANWSQYGSVPITIDYADPDLCGDSMTLAALEASGAQVVILDDPAGGLHQFTPDEITALQTYASEGHNLLATYLTFGYPDAGIDNSALAPLFGLQQGAGWTGGDSQVNPTYDIKIRKSSSQRAKPLFRHISSPYASTGFNYSQRPGDGVWSINELNGARDVAKSGDKQAAIIQYFASTYYSVFIANMPEYSGGTDDKQFIYNAIIHG